MSAAASILDQRDGFREECAVFAIFGHPEAANLAYLGLYALQHRGQESAGICSSDGRVHPHVERHGPWSTRSSAKRSCSN